MSAHAGMLHPAEAAVVSGVAVREVNRAVDESVLSPGFFTLDDGARMFVPSACVIVAFYHDSAGTLTRESRRKFIRRFENRLRHMGATQLRKTLGEDWRLTEGFLAVDLAPFIERAADGIDRLTAAEEAVTSSPDVLRGIEVLKGTRVPVRDVAASVNAGYPRERIRDAYPSLSDEQIDRAVIYAAAHPLRGRPVVARALPLGAKMSTRTVPRRKKAG